MIRAPSNCAPSPEHIAETGIVPGRTDQPASARRKTGHREKCTLLRVVDQPQRFVAPPLIIRSETLDFTFRHTKPGVLHPQRSKDPFLQKVSEGLIRQNFDQTPTHISRDGILPATAGLVA